MRKSELNTLFGGNQAFEAGKRRAQSYLVIGQELRKLRENEDLTQQQLAERTGVDQADISRLEAGLWGKRGISFEVLGKLLPVYGLRITHQIQLDTPQSRDRPFRLESARVLTEYLVGQTR